MPINTRGKSLPAFSVTYHTFISLSFSIVVGALYNQLAGAFVYGPLFGQVWVDAMNKVNTSLCGTRRTPKSIIALEHKLFFYL